jgi:hypothetical protein
MKPLAKNFRAALAFMMIFPVGAFACSCAPVPWTNKTIDEIRKEKRNYFLNEFSGAAFIGKIINRQRAKVNWIAKSESGKPADFQMYKYTIRVSDYWLGVSSPTVIVYGEPVEQIHGNSRSGTSCGFKLDRGKTYFFTPGLYERKLVIELCDFAGGGADPTDGAASEFRKIMGEPKRF